MANQLRGYKLCKSCGQPMLKKGQRRKNVHDYRHASGCEAASPAEKRYEKALWARLKKLSWRKKGEDDHGHREVSNVRVAKIT